MATFQYKDICYPSEVQAKNAFVGTFDFDNVVMDSGSAFNFSIYGVPTVSASGLISFQTLTNNGSISNVRSFQLKPCDDISSSAVFDKIPVQDMLFSAALVLVFVLGIGQGWKS